MDARELLSEQSNLSREDECGLCVQLSRSKRTLSNAVLSLGQHNRRKVKSFLATLHIRKPQKTCSRALLVTEHFRAAEHYVT